MKIVIAPDSYKESLSATEVAQAIEKGFREIFPMHFMFLFLLPMAGKVRSKR
jgi:glycerate kinase